MKIVQLNTVCGGGSTGKICVAVSEMLTRQGVENYIFYSSGNCDYPLGKRYLSPFEVKCQALKSRIFGNYGFNTKNATKRLLQELDKIAPEIVHLHNLHGHNVHLGILFSYLKEKKIKVFWTFHDCWAFTGYCPHYDMVGCDQWKTDCHACPQRKHYSWFFDRSRYLYRNKKELFSDLDLTIITPSEWLADQVRQSFLCKYEVKVIHNGIDLSVFYPRESDFRAKYHLEDKFIVLGVAFGWGFRKGLDVFVELANRLDERFQIVLVGTNDKVDKQLPSSMLFISDNIDLESFSTYEELEKKIVASNADTFMAGSDQIWHPDNCNPVFFLDFAKGKKCLSYAASMGKTKIPQENKARFEQLIRNLDTISVREQECADVIQKMTNREVLVHIDPTFLVSSDDWRQYEKPYEVKNNYILLYMLYWDKSCKEKIKKLKKITGLPVYAIANGLSGVYADKIFYDVGVEEFLWLMDHAEYVITSSFHGVAFATIFNKKFAPVINPTAPTRIENLLHLLSLPRVDIEDLATTKTFDYEKVNRRISEEKARSLQYLKKVLD